MSWQFCSALEAFDRHHSLWDAINGDCGNHILLDSEFWHCLIKYFGSANTVLAFTEKKNGRAAALIERGAYGFWQTFQPCQAPIGPILFDKSASLHWHEHIRDLMADLPGYALGFAATQQDPDFTCFGSINGAAAIEAINYIQTPRLSVRGKYEDYWNQRSKNLTHNLSRQRRRLKEQGRVLDLVIERNPETVVDAVREYGLLESTGWKGDEGSAVAADNVQGRFYHDVLET